MHRSLDGRLRARARRWASGGRRRLCGARHAGAPSAGSTPIESPSSDSRSAARSRILTAFERLRRALAPGQRRFAAHVAYYPAGNYGTAGRGRGLYRRADLASAGREGRQPARREGRRSISPTPTAAGYPRCPSRFSPIRVLITPGRFPPSVPRASIRNIPARENVRSSCLAQAGRPSLSAARKRRSTSMPWSAAGRRVAGYTMAFDASIRTKSTSDAVAFLRQHLSP